MLHPPLSTGYQVLMEMLNKARVYSVLPKKVQRHLSIGLIDMKVRIRKSLCPLWRIPLGGGGRRSIKVLGPLVFIIQEPWVITKDEQLRGPVFGHVVQPSLQPPELGFEQVRLPSGIAK